MDAEFNEPECACVRNVIRLVSLATTFRIVLRLSITELLMCRSSGRLHRTERSSIANREGICIRRYFIAIRRYFVSFKGTTIRRHFIYKPVLGIVLPIEKSESNAPRSRQVSVQDRQDKSRTETSNRPVRHVTQQKKIRRHKTKSI